MEILSVIQFNPLILQIKKVRFKEGVQPATTRYLDSQSILTFLIYCFPDLFFAHSLANNSGPKENKLCNMYWFQWHVLDFKPN